MTRGFVLFALLAASSGPASAGTSDFARGAAIDVAQGFAAYRVTVPADVYSWTTRDDLGDVRVLDGAGSEVPYVVRVTPGADALSDWAELPVFALPRASAATGAAAVNIQLGKDGAVVAVQGAATPANIGGYLVDASKYTRAIDDIELVWDAADENVLVATTLLASDDLSAWREVVRSTTLASLRTNGESVKLDRIAAHGARAKYLKLELDRELPVTRVRVRTREDAPAPRASLILDPTAAGDAFEFDTGGRFPVDRVAIELDAPTYLLEARVFARASDDVAWRELGTRSFYRAIAGELAATSDPMAVAPTQHRHWRVVPSSTLASPPRLHIQWVPHEVVFLVQGGPPYVLVYGQAGIAPREWPISQLLQRTSHGTDLDRLPIAATRAPEMLGGEARLVPPPAPIDWRSVVLWGVLVLGVGVVGGLALRLIRQGAR